MIHIRPACISDAAALAQLGIDTFTETFGHLYLAEDLDAYLKSSFSADLQARQLADAQVHHLVAEINSIPVAYAKMGTCGLPVEKPPVPHGELHRFYIASAHQGKGLGVRMMEHVLHHAEKCQWRHLYLGVWENNHRAQGFYTRFGFEVIGEYAYPVGRQVDRELIMRKVL